jgi:hypothetical protein
VNELVADAQHNPKPYRLWRMHLLRLLLPLFLFAGCQTTAGIAPGQVSCQPVGMDPAPVAFVFLPGPATAASAEQTALGMIRACASSQWKDAIDSTSLTSTVEAGTAELPGPNKGSDVWLVRVDAKWKDGVVESHYLIEVNKATGVPTLVGVG